MSASAPIDSVTFPTQVSNPSSSLLSNQNQITKVPDSVPIPVVAAPLSAEPPLPKEILEKFDVLAQTVLAMSERILKVERDRREKEKIEKEEEDSLWQMHV